MSALSSSAFAHAPPPPDWASVEATILAEYASLGTEGLVHLRVERLTEDPFHLWIIHQYFDPTFGVDGTLGWSADGAVVYDAHVTLGLLTRFSGGHFAIRSGIGVDAIGERIPRAWTIPVDVLLRLGPRSTKVALVAGPRFAVAGAERPVGWRAALQLTRRDVMRPAFRYGLRDLQVELGVERKADATFITLGLGLAARTRFGEEWDAWHSDN